MAELDGGAAMKILGPVTIKLPYWKRVPIPGGDGKNFTSERDGFTVAEIRIAVDEQALADAIGPKAIRNKKKRSMLQSGAIVVEAFNIRKEAQ